MSKKNWMAHTPLGVLNPPDINKLDKPVIEKVSNLPADKRNLLEDCKSGIITRKELAQALRGSTHEPS